MGLVTALQLAAIFTTVPLGILVALVFGLHKLVGEQPIGGRRPGWSATLIIAIGAGIVVWWVWLSWGSYYEDPPGQFHGLYRPWQVVACGATMVVVTIGLGWWSRWRGTGPFAAAFGALWGFSMCWAVSAFRVDETGLSAFGLLMLLLGGTAGLGVVAGILAGLRHVPYPGSHEGNHAH